MRKFKVICIELYTNKDETHLKDQIITLIPILSNHYFIQNVEFRCIEHKPGSMKLKNDDYLLSLKEVY